jgi:hypothetical protein
MGFGQYDGTLDNAEKRVGQFAGCPGLLPGAPSRDGLKVLRKVVRDRLEHARNGLLQGKNHRLGSKAFFNFRTFCPTVLANISRSFDRIRLAMIQTRSYLEAKLSVNNPW